MPSYVYTQQNPSDVNVLRNQKFNYGTTPKQAVVEQNQTYFAYFDGVGGTGPELIDQTAYFIKYIIDTQGNVANPEPDVVPSRPQATALYNLIDNFEPGKNAIVKLIGNDPLLNENPNDDALTGRYTITHVGRIVPILVTETGQNIQDYTTTMSFGSPTTPSPPNIFTIPNVYAQFQADLSATPTPTVNNLYTDLSYNSNLINSNLNIWTNSSPEYIINSSSIQTGTRIKIEAKIFVSSSYQYVTDIGDVYYGGSFNLRLLKNGSPILESPIVYYNKGVTYSSDDYYTYSTPLGEVDGYHILTSNWIDYSANDEFKIQYRAINDNTSFPLQILGALNNKYLSSITFTQEYQPGISGSSTTSPQQINGVNVAYSGSDGYITVAINVYNDNGGISGLLFNDALSNIYQTNAIQNLDSASVLMNFSPITIPFSNVKPGDWIRFEYNKDQVYNISNILLNEETGNVELVITPSLSTISGFNTQTMDLNHFVIYRVINDGTYIVLDVPKPVVGNSFAGIIQPEFISKELVEKYDKIIVDLTTKEIIQ